MFYRVIGDPESSKDDRSIENHVKCSGSRRFRTFFTNVLKWIQIRIVRKLGFWKF